MQPLKNLAAAAAAACVQGCTLMQVIVHNFPGLDDHGIFASRTVVRAAAASPLRTLARQPRCIAELRVPGRNGGDLRLVEYLAQTRTAAFVVLQDDRVVFERYGEGHDARSLFNSFSIAKSVIGTLVGIALAEGKIASLDDTVAQYRSDFAGTAYGDVTLGSLLSMTSGVVDEASLLPNRARYYYGEDLHRLTTRAVAGDQGRHGWHYSEGDVQVLGFVLEHAVGKTVSAYLAEKIWAPLGMESVALWSLDREDGSEKAFCCLRARARDFARFGLFYLQGGRWNGVQVVPADWAARSALPGVTLASGDVHRQLWWSRADAEGDFYAYGHNGQYLYVHPRSRTVIVKFSETSNQDPVPMFRVIAGALQRPENIAEFDRLEARIYALH